MLFNPLPILRALFIALAFCWGQPVTAQSAVTPIKREPVEFPREAVKAGVDSGMVRVKLLIDAAGNVLDVQILESSPPRVFDRVVRTSMVLWKFNPGSDKRTYETKVEFNVK